MKGRIAIVPAAHAAVAEEKCTEKPEAVPGVWALQIAEVTGHNLEARGREEVNRLLAEGWLLLHVYTLRYAEEGVWRERPMAILGRPRGLTAGAGAGRRTAEKGGTDENPAGSG